jgi:Methylamine utilisation protein MauE
MTEPILEAFTVTLFAAVFLAAGVSKLRALETFAGVVQNFRLLPERLAPVVAYTLPAVEVAVAAALLMPLSRSYGAWAAAGLLGIFTVAVAINLLRGRREIDCGCFSSELKQRLSWWLVMRNVALAGLALWLGIGSLATDGNWGVAWLLGGVAAATTATLYVAAATLSAIANDVAARRAAIVAAHRHQGVA